MRINKILMIILLLCISLSHSIYATEYTVDDMEETLKIYSEENYFYKTKKLEDFSESIWKRHGLLVLKEQAEAMRIHHQNIIKSGEIKKSTNEVVKGQKQYLGITPDNFLVENPDFPATKKTYAHVSAGQYIAY